jgi:hypothetical protein
MIAPRPHMALGSVSSAGALRQSNRKFLEASLRSNAQAAQLRIADGLRQAPSDNRQLIPSIDDPDPVADCGKYETLLVGLWLYRL